MMTIDPFFYFAGGALLLSVVGLLLMVKWQREMREQYVQDMEVIDRQFKRIYEETERLKHRPSAMPTTHLWWEVLGVSRHATEAEIKKAYQQKVREAHPDVNDGDDTKFRQVQEAFEAAKQSPTLH